MAMNLMRLMVSTVYYKNKERLLQDQAIGEHRRCTKLLALSVESTLPDSDTVEAFTLRVHIPITLVYC